MKEEMKEEIEEETEEEVEEEVEETEEGDEGKDDKDKGGKTFTQEEVNKMLAREKRQGKKSILKSLGFNNIESAKKSLSNKSKEDDKNDKTSVNENDEVKKYAEKYAKAMIKNEVLISGVLKNYQQEVLDLVLAKVDIDGDDLDESVKDELENIKGKFKMFFEKTEEGTDTGTEDKSNSKSKGTGSNVRSNQKNKGKSSLAERLAKDASKRTSSKSSFFD